MNQRHLSGCRFFINTVLNLVLPVSQEWRLRITTIRPKLSKNWSSLWKNKVLYGNSSFLVGIDLGTTNTVVAYCEINDDLQHAPVSLFDIDQLIGPGEVVRKPLLPSFRYHPAQGQISPSDLTMPWEPSPVEGDIKNVIVGEWARELGAKVEGRQVSSAKSWLSHQAVDRNSDILPWAGAADVDKVSPVVASASYLNHIRQAWNYCNPSKCLKIKMLW